MTITSAIAYLQELLCSNATFAPLLWQSAALILFFLLIRPFVARPFTKIFRKLDCEALLRNISKHTAFLCCALWLFYVLPSYHLPADSALLSNALWLLHVACALSTTRMALYLVDLGFIYFKGTFAEKHRLDVGYLPFFSNLAKAAVLIMALVFLPRFFVVYDITPWLTTFSIGATASTTMVAFACKDIMANVFGGILIILDKPFHTSDNIAINGVEGMVQKVDSRTTSIKTPSGAVVHIPNSTFITKNIVNYGQVTHVNIKVKTTTTCDGDTLQRFLKDAGEAVTSFPEAILEKCDIRLQSMGEQATELVLHCSFSKLSPIQKIATAHGLVQQIKSLTASQGLLLEVQVG